MILYSHPDDPAGHAMRLILAEKGVAAQLVEVSGQAPPDDLLNLNPYGNMPTLVTREVTLFDPRIIAEYLDDRYPHPPLLATEPALRARVRLFINEVGGEWYGQCRLIAAGTGREKAKARHALCETLIANDEIFAVAPFLLSDSYGLADCIAAPVLWRLPALGIPLPREAHALRGYMQRVFKRPSFVVSLTGNERAMAAM